MEYAFETADGGGLCAAPPHVALGQGKTRAYLEQFPFWGHGTDRNEMSAMQPLL